MWLKQPKLQLSIAWIVGIIASIVSISSSYSKTYIRGWEVKGYGFGRNWLTVLVIPVVVIGALLIITLQTLPYMFKSILHKIKIEKNLKNLGFILTGIIVGFLILILILSVQLSVQTEREPVLFEPEITEFPDIVMQWLDSPLNK